VSGRKLSGNQERETCSAASFTGDHTPLAKMRGSLTGTDKPAIALHNSSPGISFDQSILTSPFAIYNAHQNPNMTESQRLARRQAAADSNIESAAKRKRPAYTTRNAFKPRPQSPFCRLPAELRDRIYSYALISAEPDTERVELSTLGGPPLIATCRQIQSEALPIFFAENKFRLHYHLQTFVSCPRTIPQRSHLRLLAGRHWSGLEEPCSRRRDQ